MKKIHMFTLFTTNKCNLNCIYCSTEAGKKLQNELTLDEKKKIILEAKDMGAKLVNICGSGEPMLDDDFYKLVGFIDSLGLNTEVVTNGTNINKKNAEWLLRHNAYIVFKLNSLNPETTDRLVGKTNAYRWTDFGNIKIPYGLKCLIDAGYNRIQRKMFFCAPFQIQCIISRYNYKDIPEIAQFCRDNGIYFFLESLIWEGKARKNRKTLELDANEYKWLYNRLKKIMNIGFLIHQKRVSCVLERNPTIDEQGNIRICYSRDCNVGNIRKHSLMELFEKAQTIRKKHRIAFYRGLLNKNKFKTCAGREYFKN